MNMPRGGVVQQALGFGCAESAREKGDARIEIKIGQLVGKAGKIIRLSAFALNGGSHRQTKGVENDLREIVVDVFQLAW